MAANDLPDLWSTHGWSLERYSEYLTDLKDEKWIKDLHPSIKPVITNKAGNVYILPIDVDVAGVAYNKDAVAKAGVDVDKIKTWDDFTAAMEKVKNSGTTPVHVGGKDSWTIGNVADYLAASIYVSGSDHTLATDLQNGKFDTESWDILGKTFKTMKDKKYLNRDVLTSGYTDSARALATGEAAFAFYGNYILTEAWSFNPDANLGFFPVPSFEKDGSPFVISGEKSTVGIWKDSKNLKEAKLFLEFLTRPEVLSRLATADGIPAGLVTAKSDTGKLEGDYLKWANIQSIPYFDREYLPGGMWDTLCATGAGVLSGDMTIKEASEKVSEDFYRLYK